MNRLGLISSGVILALAACQPSATSVYYDPYDYDFRYAIYDDYWNGDVDIDRPDRPQPPDALKPRPEQPIYRPPVAARPQPSYRPSSVSGGRVGGAGSLRGSRR